MVMLYMKIALFVVLGILIRVLTFSFNKYITIRAVVTKTDAKHKHILGFLNRDI